MLAIVALGGTATINAVATGSRQPVPAVAAPAPQQPATATAPQESTGTTASGSNSTTNHANSSAFGQQVVQQVKTCKTQAAAAGTHGIGQCVSSWVVQHNGGASHHTSH